LCGAGGDTLPEAAKLIVTCAIKAAGAGGDYSY
jgi:hypothetical protein